MDAYIEAVFVTYPHQSPHNNWIDESTETHYVFSCRFGAVRIRKRESYPQTFACIHNDILEFGYGRPGLGRSIADSPLSNVPEQLYYDDEFLYIAIDSVRRSVTVQRDAQCTVPIFIGNDSDKLVISNHYSRAYQLLGIDQPSVNVLTVFQFLLDAFTFTNTLDSRIRVLIDRSRAQWQRGQLSYDFAPDSSVQQIASQRDGDPKLAGKMLEKTLDAYWTRYGNGNAGAELSCGVDTTLINGYYASRLYPLALGSLIYPGSAGTTLTKKLSLFADYFGATSHSIPIVPESDFPLSKILKSGSQQPFHHHDDIYQEIFSKLADYFVSAGVDTVFRGYGGDELCENVTTYSFTGKPSEATASLLTSFKKLPYLTPGHTSVFSTLERSDIDFGKSIPVMSVGHIRTNISLNNVYLDRGIWPVSPLADPRLYLYFQSLPVRYRHNKNILRAYHHSRNYPATFSDKRTNDDFGGFFLMTVSRIIGPLLNDLLPTSVFAASHLLDESVLKREVHFAINHLDSVSGRLALFNLFKFASLELNFARMGVTALPLD